MVCKENVVSWFGNLSSYKRIDVMCTLLNMCLPFEIRYLGTYIEDSGKRDYTDLRESENHANSTSELIEMASVGIGDKRTRRKLALYMALLRSCNYSCAVIFHKILASLDSQEIANILNGATFAPDDQPMEELFLLYAMALNHPAFTYEQKSTFGNIYLKLQEEESRLNLPKPAAAVNASYKSPQGCAPCGNPNERPVTADSNVEMPANCSMLPPPPIQTYHGDMGMRGNPMVSGVPPGLSLPPPGLCLPSHEQMTMGTAPGAQYLHLGFPTVNHMTSWTGQVMMGNPLMYHTNDMLAYPQSSLVSRQSSPSHSRSPSRSNSPLGRRNNQMPRTSSQVIQSTCNTITTSTSSSSVQPSNMTSTCAATPLHQPPPVSSIGCTSRSLPGGPPPMLPPRSVPPPPITSSSSAYSRHNSVENASTPIAPATKQPPPPPRLRAPTSGPESQRDNTAKDVTNFKGNLPNTSFGEIRRMSDEDLRDMGMSPNALGQLRNIVRSQTSNGLSQLGMEKKLENTNNATHPVNETIENEEQQLQQQQNLQQQQPQQQQHQPMQHHPHSHVNSPNIRRYPGISPLEPSQMQMYPPPPMYPQNAQCYSCISVSVAGLPTRYSRCNAQHLYCTTQLQALRLDPENSRHCSQSSSSESTGSRSPPETPPAAPWVSSPSETVLTSSSTTEHQASTGTSSHHSTMSQSHQGQAQSMSHMSERPRNQSKKNQSHVMRQKNQMVNGVASGGNGSNNNGGGGGGGGGGNGNNGGLSNIPHCVSFPGPPTPSQVTFLPHAHFPALRPSTGIYTNFSHAAYARPPTYQATYQPNGEMMYQYPGPGGTPPPPPAVAAPPQTYMPSAPVVTYTPAVPPAKISCYNCGSNSHLAADCKDQTMEELTKRATYRLDYTLMKQSGECPSSDK